MKVQRVLRNLYEIYDVAKDIFLFRYPLFIYGINIANNVIPAFCLHAISPDEFELMLAYLKENHFTCITASELHEIFTGKREYAKSKTVLLTFDDGTTSTWSVVYPLLKKYGFKATVFLIPGLVSSDETYFPNLDDVWNGKATINELYARDGREWQFVTWNEIKKMHDSGVIDFQSHTLQHEMMYVSPVIVDFMRPDEYAKHSKSQYSMIPKDSYTSDGNPKWGIPIYKSAPRMSGKPKYYDDSILREMCVEYVNKSGGTLFFNKAGWKSELFSVVAEYKSKNEIQDRSETQDEQREALYYDLKRSKEMIEEHLPGKKVEHLCYPWAVQSDLSMSISKQVGYKTNFTGKMGNNIALTDKNDPYKIYRMGQDFFYLLPGEGRISLFDVLKMKISSRLRHGTPYVSY